jgi:hypothetical protein
MKTRTSFPAKSSHNSLPSGLVASAVVRGLGANYGVTAPKLRGGGPKLGGFSRAKAGS